METFDVAVIGAGPAGITAAIYAARNNLKTAIFEHKLVGGAIATTTAVENYPGFESVQGPDLAAKWEAQLDFVGAKKIFESVEHVARKSEGIFTIQTVGGQYQAKTIVLATGSEYRKLNIKGEDEYRGKGISFCATCDAPFFKKKTVAVIGGGNSALTSALLLTEQCQKVYVIHRRAEFRGEAVLLDQLKAAKSVEFVLNSAPVEIKGDKGASEGGKVKSVLVEDVNTKQKREIPVDGVFINVGFEPLNSIAKQLGAALGADGYVQHNEKMETSVPGFFVAGDITGGPANVKQIVTAESEGCVAAASVYAYIKKAKMADLNY